MTAQPPALLVIAERLAAAGLPLPVPLARAVDRAPLPLAIGSNEAWRAWGGAHGYDDRQILDLLLSLRLLANSMIYLKALAAEGGWRHDADGRPVETVSEEHRAYGLQTLSERRAARKRPRPARSPHDVAIAAAKSKPTLSLPQRGKGDGDERRLDPRDRSPGRTGSAAATTPEAVAGRRQRRLKTKGRTLIGSGRSRVLGV